MDDVDEGVTVCQLPGEEGGDAAVNGAVNSGAAVNGGANGTSVNGSTANGKALNGESGKKEVPAASD
jgi:hypothetical protein